MTSEEAECLLQDLKDAERWNELRARGWPDHLIKAVYDEFQYVLGLRSGLVLMFESAEPQVDGVFVRLNGVHDCVEKGRVCEGPRFPFVTERGLDVRVNEIAWVLDAPWGS